LIPAPESPKGFLGQFAAWASMQAEISEVILVGSYATGRSTPDSDIDLIILSKNPKNYLDEPNWIEKFGVMKNVAVEDWGKVISLRVWYSSGLEVEFGLAGQDWIEKPIDEGSRKILQNRYESLLDRTGRLVLLDE
jgi:predicted nucleotidyltransferase